MVGTKEMVEDTVGKTIGAMTEADGKAISLAMHPLGTRNGRRITPTADRMLETGERLSMAAAITTVLAPGRALGTLGNDLEGTRGPTAIRVREEKDRVREEEEKEKRETSNLLLRHTRERPRAGARTRTGTITSSPPRVGSPTMTMKIGAIRGRPTGSLRSIYRK